MTNTLTIDIFCRIVDNYGDIGVCWRFAQCLQRDLGCAVRLVVDDFTVFKKIEPALDTALDTQTLRGVGVLRWRDGVLARHYAAPADAVIEAFACTLPDTVTTTMRHAPVPPVWVDLEYLSAEDWVETCHAIPSPHPATGLTKTLFFPGFTTRTGGLVREAGLMEARAVFQSSRAAQDAWRTERGLPPVSDGHLDISLFCYDDAPLKDLIALLGANERPARIIVPAGVCESVSATAADVSVLRIPFLSSADYDRLLWTCDVNFVRGEDSFVRAQWAARPMVWHIYPQAEDHHFVKLNAFLARYSANLAPECTDLLEKVMVLWNERVRDITGPLQSAGPGWLDQLPTLTAHAASWADGLARQDDLATQLVRFISHQNNKS